MLCISARELIESGVDSREDVSLSAGEHLRDSFQIGPTRSAELSFIQVVSSARRAEHLFTSAVGVGYADSTLVTMRNQTFESIGRSGWCI